MHEPMRTRMKFSEKFKTHDAIKAEVERILKMPGEDRYRKLAVFAKNLGKIPFGKGVGKSVVLYSIMAELKLGDEMAELERHLGRGGANWRLRTAACENKEDWNLKVCRRW